MVKFWNTAIYQENDLKRKRNGGFFQGVKQMPDLDKLTRRGKLLVYLNGSLPEWNIPYKNRFQKNIIGDNVCYLAAVYFFPLPMVNNSTDQVLDDYIKRLKEQNQDRSVIPIPSLSSIDPSFSIWVSETQNEKQDRNKTENKRK